MAESCFCPDWHIKSTGQSFHGTRDWPRLLSHVRGKTLAGIPTYAHKSTVHRHVGFLTGPNGWLLFQRQFSRSANGECVRYHPELTRALITWLPSHWEWKHANVQAGSRALSLVHKSRSLGRAGVAAGGTEQVADVGLHANCTDVFNSPKPCSAFSLGGENRRGIEILYTME